MRAICVVVRSMRSPLAGTRRLPLAAVTRADPGTRRLIGRMLYGGSGVTHRMNLELPPAPGADVVTLHDVVAWRFPDESDPVAAAADELRVNQMKLLHIAGRRIVLGKTDNGYVAFHDSCTHRGGSLAAGSMICETVQCPWHGSQFSVKDGTVKAGPAKMPISVYPVSERNGRIYVLL